MLLLILQSFLWNLVLMFKKVNNIHFTGIGGIGMSGIAELLMNLGFNITGSDINYSQNVKRLEKIGIKISMNHNKNNIENADTVVYSSAIPFDNPEIIAAKNKSPDLYFLPILSVRTFFAPNRYDSRLTPSRIPPTLLK